MAEPTERRRCVLIGSSNFPEERKLAPLHCPNNDVDGIAEVLTSCDHGGFDPTEAVILKNVESHAALQKVQQTLSRARREDLVLIYYSGHGQSNLEDKLHLLTTDTSLEMLESTSIPVDRILSFIDLAQCKRVILILDCCFSGTAGKGLFRSGLGNQLRQAAQGRGTYLLTASSGLQVAIEKEGDDYGLLTKHIIGGIRTGAADRDEDGLITMDELYSYVHEKVLEESPQEPEKYSKARGELVIARSTRLPRAERCARGRDVLLELAKRQVLPDALFAKAWEVLWSTPGQRRTEFENYERLLDDLVLGKVGAPEFVARWHTMATTAPKAVSPAAVHQDARPMTSERVVSPPPGPPQPTAFRVLRTFSPLPKGALAAVFSNGGGWLACSAGDGSVSIFETETGRILKHWTAHAAPAWSLAFNPQGLLLLSAGGDKEAMLWHAPDGVLRAKFSEGATALLAAAFHPDGERVAVAGLGDTIAIWNWRTGERGATLSTGQRTVQALTFMPREDLLISAGVDKTVKVWDLNRTEPVNVLAFHSSAVLALAVTRDGKLLASAGRDGRVKLWHTATWKPGPTLRGHTHSVLSLAFDPASRLLASGGADDCIHVWRVESGESECAMRSGHGGVHCLTFHPGGGLLVSGGADQRVRLWSRESDKKGGD
jgi:uncharacterized caspase-like protein